jgi:hypothetical protein
MTGRRLDRFEVRSSYELGGSGPGLLRPRLTVEESQWLAKIATDPEELR